MHDRLTAEDRRLWWGLVRRGLRATDNLPAIGNTLTVGSASVRECHSTDQSG